MPLFQFPCHTTTRQCSPRQSFDIMVHPFRNPSVAPHFLPDRIYGLSLHATSSTILDVIYVPVCLLLISTHLRTVQLVYPLLPKHIFLFTDLLHSSYYFFCKCLTHIFSIKILSILQVLDQMYFFYKDFLPQQKWSPLPPLKV